MLNAHEPDTTLLWLPLNASTHAAATAATLGQTVSLLAAQAIDHEALYPAICHLAVQANVGVALNVDMLIVQGDGISDSRADVGDAKNWSQQVSGRRQELTDQALLTPRTGLILQIQSADKAALMQALRGMGLSKDAHFIGKTRPEGAALSEGKGQVQVWRDTQKMSGVKLVDLAQK